MQKGNRLMGKLSKAKKMTDAEKYCIQGMHWNEMDTKSIAKVLGRDLETVEEYVEKLDKQSESSSFIINETGSGNKGVAIMTPAGSQRVDDARAEIIPERDQTSTIHSIHD